MIPVMFVWLNYEGKKVKKHAILPAIPPVGAKLTPPGGDSPMNVRGHEWDCSQGNGSQSVIYIALD